MNQPSPYHPSNSTPFDLALFGIRTPRQRYELDRRDARRRLQCRGGLRIIEPGMIPRRPYVRLEFGCCRFVLKKNQTFLRDLLTFYPHMWDQLTLEVLVFLNGDVISSMWAFCVDQDIAVPPELALLVESHFAERDASAKDDSAATVESQLELPLVLNGGDQPCP